MTRIRFDHIAIGMSRIVDATEMLVGTLGGVPADGQASGVFRWGSWTFEGGGTIEILEPGLLATLQDLGRPGAASVGVSTSGALDRAALRTANRLVGNAEDAAAIEVTMGGFRATADADLWFAVTGAWGSIRLGAEEIDPYEAHHWPLGEELHLDWFGHGARAYLAVRGGLDGPATLGSRATDILAGLGPRPLRAGDPVSVRGGAVVPIPAAVVAPWGAPHDDEVDVELAPGPRGDWFAASAHRTLFEKQTSPCQVFFVTGRHRGGRSQT